MLRSFSSSSRLAVTALALLLIALGLAWLVRGWAQPNAAEGRLRLTLAQAEALVRAYVFANQPAMNPAAQFPLAEKTSPEAWQRMGVQLYQVTEGVQQYQSYVIAGGQVYPIGVSFGGMGVHTHLVTDLDQDGEPELAYAYSFGSGIAQSGVGLLYPLADGGYASTSAANFHHPGELHLERLDDARLRVLAGGSGALLGNLHLSAGQLVLAAPQ